MILIGIGHRSENGKDTLAKFMKDKFEDLMPNKKVIITGWSYKLKMVCYALYADLGLQRPEFYDTEDGRRHRNIKLPRIDLTPVEIWIHMGSKAVRAHVWVRTWVEYVRNSINCDILICPDTRFPIEIEVCDYTILCHNPRIPNRAGESVDHVLKDYNGWNFVVVNDGSKLDLQREGDNVVHEIVCSLTLGESK